MELNKMIEEFEEATELAESCSHTKDTEYTKLCREVADFLNWFKNQDLVRRDDVIFEIRNCPSKCPTLNNTERMSCRRCTRQRIEQMIGVNYE